MSTVLDAPVAANGVPLLSTEPKRLGPVSRRLVVRFVSALAIVELSGLLLALLSGNGRARATGLSLMLPGGGLLYEAMPIAFIRSGVGRTLPLSAFAAAALIVESIAKTVSSPGPGVGW